MKKEKLLIGVTGASGQIYAARLYQLIKTELPQVEPTLLFTDTAKLVWKDELQEPLLSAVSSIIDLELIAEAPTLSLNNSSFYHPFASGSNRADKMVIIPATMTTIARIAAGLGSDLLARAADVMLKERAPLYIVPRETPLNAIHLRNMATVTEAGAHLIPASPQFYSKPSSLAELIDNFCRRTLQIMGYNLPTPKFEP